MADVDDFVADPETFMQRNIVQVTEVDPDLVDTQPVRVTLHDTGLKLMNKVGGKLFELYITKTVGPTSLRAYFCPYKNDNAYFVMLGNDADFMFTPQMAGCTFGIGSQYQGSCRVGHVNLVSIRGDWDKEDDKRERMYEAQRAFLRNRLNIGSNRMVDPDVYRGGGRDQSATTYGVRANGAWTFKTLRYRKAGSKTYLHLGVHTEVNN
jgi:hypothetical protein